MFSHCLGVAEEILLKLRSGLSANDGLILNDRQFGRLRQGGAVPGAQRRQTVLPFGVTI